MLYTALQTLALLLTLESAFFLARGSVVLSAEAIAQLAGSYWDFNPHLVESLARQSVDSRVGVFLLLAAFVAQVFTLWRGPSIDDLGPADRTGIVIALSIGVAVLIGSLWIASWHAANVASAVEEILKERG